MSAVSRPARRAAPRAALRRALHEVLFPGKALDSGGLLGGHGMADPARMDEEFDVGGVRLPRPFKLLRLGHFGVNAIDPEAARDFYCRILGFRVSDPIDFGVRLPPEERGK